MKMPIADARNMLRVYRLHAADTSRVVR